MKLLKQKVASHIILKSCEIKFITRLTDEFILHSLIIYVGVKTGLQNSLFNLKINQNLFNVARS